MSYNLSAMGTANKSCKKFTYSRFVSAKPFDISTMLYYTYYFIYSNTKRHFMQQY